MADIEIWGPSVSEITTPAATDRAVWATGPGAGGYSVRGSFSWRNSDGYLVAQSLGQASAPVAGTVDDTSATFFENDSGGYGLNVGVSGTGGSWLQGQRSTGAGDLFPIALNPLGGGLLIGVAGIPNYANDAAAAAGGVPVSGIYRNGSVLMIRVS